MGPERLEFSLEGPDDLICKQGLGVSVNQVMYGCSLNLKDQYLAVYEGSDDQGEQFNRSRYYYADTMVHFGHLVSKIFNVSSGFVYEPHVLQGLDKCTNGGRVDLLLLLDNNIEYLGTLGVLPKVFLIVSQSSIVMDMSK